MLPIDTGGLGNLTTGFVQRFNDENPDFPHVHYFSYAGAEVHSSLLVPTHKWIEIQGGSEEDKVNDGLVSVTSAKWPDQLAEEPWGADHLSEVGYNLDAPNLKTDFDYLVAFDRIILRAI